MASHFGEQDSDGFGAIGAFAADDSCGTNTRLLEERGFEVSGVDVETGSGDDDVASAAREAELAGCVLGGEVAGGKPLAKSEAGYYR